VGERHGLVGTVAWVWQAASVCVCVCVCACPSAPTLACLLLPSVYTAARTRPLLPPHIRCICPHVTPFLLVTRLVSASDVRKYDDVPGLQDNGEILFNWLAGERWCMV
jgi:hypothetical protein